MTLYNADDFGITVAQAEHILNCRREGKLTGVSAMPNSPHLEAAMELIQDDPDLYVAVHLNLTEGCCLSEPAKVPLLAAADGRFKLSFFKIFALSLGPKRRALKEQMALELSAQIDRVMPLMGDRPLRLDGHQHIQMIPVVMETIGDLVREKGYPVSYIRYTREPRGPYLRHMEFRRDYGPVNVVKNLVLNVFGWMDKKYMRQMGLTPHAAMGLVISGTLEYRLVSNLLPDMERAAAKWGADLELVMHPGWGVGPGEGLDVPGGPFEAFYLDSGRRREYECLTQL